MNIYFLTVKEPYQFQSHRATYKNTFSIFGDLLGSGVRKELQNTEPGGGGGILILPAEVAYLGWMA